MSVNNQAECDREEPFRYGLLELFFVITTACIVLALNRGLGGQATALLIGLIVSVIAIVLLRIENVIVGGFLGWGLGIAILIVIRIVFAGDRESVSILALSLCYPLIGYVVGMICAADRLLRHGG